MTNLNEAISSIYQINPSVLESIAQWIEQRGVRIPVGQIVGYQRERLNVWLEQAAAQSIPDNSQTPITFDTIRSDEQKVFDGTNKITLPYAGVYLATMQGGFANSSLGTQRTFVITQNGVSRAVVDKTTGFNGRVSLSAQIVAAKGDVVKAEQFQDTGGALNTFGCSFGLTLLNAY